MCLQTWHDAFLPKLIDKETIRRSPLWIITTPLMFESVCSTSENIRRTTRQKCTRLTHVDPITILKRMKHFQVTWPAPSVAHVELVQCSNHASPSKSFWEELRVLFTGFSSDSKAKTVVISSIIGFGNSAFANVFHNEDKFADFDSTLAAVECCGKGTNLCPR